MIGGSGERKTLQPVARYGDMCNLFDLPGTGFADNLRHKLAVLQQHCDAAGRDYKEIERTTVTNFDLAPNAHDGLSRLVDHVWELAELGIDHAIIGPREPWDDATLDAVAGILDDVHAIPGQQAA